MDMFNFQFYAHLIKYLMLFLIVERFLFVDCNDVKSHYSSPRLDLPGKEYKPLNRQVKHI